MSEPNQHNQPIKLYNHPDGVVMDEVSFTYATDKHLESYARATQALHNFSTPSLYDHGDPHLYLIFGLLDGNGKDVAQDPIHASNDARHHINNYL